MRRATTLAALLISLFSANTLGDNQRLVFSGEIDFIIDNDNPAILTSFDVGTTVYGTFRYGVNDSTAVVMPHGDNETDYLFSGSTYGATIFNTSPVATILDATVVMSDHTWFYGPVTEFSQILGIPVQDGDPFDGWTVRTDEEPVNGVTIGVTFFAFTNFGLVNDQNYLAEPPAGIGGGNFDGAIFYVMETDAEGDVIFTGIGAVDTYYCIGYDSDLDGDGYVGLADLDLVLRNWNQNVPTGNPLADVSGPGSVPDGFIGLDDLDVVLRNWNTGTPPHTSIPEPASAVVLLAGMLLFAKRNRVDH